MNKPLKIILSILIVIIALVLICTLPYFIDPSYDKTDSLSVEEIQDILDKRYDLSNIYAKHTRQLIIGDLENLTLYSEYFIKGDMAKFIQTTENGKLKIIQEDRTNKDIIWIFETNEAVMRLNYEPQGAFNMFINYDILDLSNYDNVKYLGRTEIKEREAVVIRILRDDNIKEILYIDTETGMVVKHETKSYLFRCTDTTEIKLGTITDKDVNFIDYETVYPDFKVVNISE